MGSNESDESIDDQMLQCIKTLIKKQHYHTWNVDMVLLLIVVPFRQVAVQGSIKN